jgi:hypothetical protein
MIFDGSLARVGVPSDTASGHTAAAPPTSVMNSRRFITNPELRR